MKTSIICGLLALFLVGCCGWPCNWPDPPQPPGTRITKVYAVHVDYNMFKEIQEGEMDLFEAAQQWHQDRALSIHFAAGDKCIEILTAEEYEKMRAERKDPERTDEQKKLDEEYDAKVQPLVHKDLRIHFIEEKGLFIMTGNGRLTFGDTIIDVTDKHLWLTALKEKDEDDDDPEEIIKVAVVSDWNYDIMTSARQPADIETERPAASKPTEEEERRVREENEDIDETINLRLKESKRDKYYDNTFDNTTPRAMEVLELIDVHITERFPSAQVRKFRPEIFSRIIDLTVTPEGKWWEGVGLYPHPRKCELKEKEEIQEEAPAETAPEE